MFARFKLCITFCRPLPPLFDWKAIWQKTCQIQNITIIFWNKWSMLRKVRVILSFSFRNVWSVKCILLLFKYSSIQVYFKGLLNLHLLKTYCSCYGEYLVKYYLKKEFISPSQFFYFKCTSKSGSSKSGPVRYYWEKMNLYQLTCCRTKEKLVEGWVNKTVGANIANLVVFFKGYGWFALDVLDWNSVSHTEIQWQI